MTQPKLLRFLRIKSVDVDVEKFIKSVVKQNLKYRERNNVRRQDFFQLLIQLRNTGKVQSDDNWQNSKDVDKIEHTMTLNEIAAQVYIFYIAAFETSSTTISFCLFELAKNQHIQLKVHEEIDTILNKHDGQITYESIGDMKYLDACIDGKAIYGDFNH